MTDTKTITCLKELEKLEFGDIVEFTIKKEILKYEVKSWFLNIIRDNDFDYKMNEEIFRILGINKNKIAEKIYRYPLNGNGGDWPNSKANDYSALTRLVKELYLIIEEREPKYTKFTRFEIMDI